MLFSNRIDAETCNLPDTCLADTCNLPATSQAETSDLPNRTQQPANRTINLNHNL